MGSNIIEHLRVEAKSHDLEDVCTSDFQGSRQDLLDSAADEIERLREYAFEVSKALTGLTVGGSEFFADNKLGFYKADIPACVKNVEWRMEQRAKLAVARALSCKEPK